MNNDNEQKNQDFDELEKDLTEKKQAKKTKQMKVSGKSVFKLQRIIKSDHTE